ncbi:DUF4013 domain-containing protein [Salinigranum marinum]|uniref:DUF4013 domain-containing protein n=1 Tax=Salinigranum marinum TaxID=1515595 RepID=UPI002989F333|nr:DUF4013 domain-containing protein [Salinigranum marinum]
MALDIEALLTYPMESDDWLVTVLIGTVLTLLSVFIIPGILVYGYLVRVLRAGMDDAPEPPAFGDWGSLFVEGLVATVILFVYQLIPLVVFAVTVGGSLAAIATGSRVGAGVGMAGLFGGLALSVVLALVFSYVGLVGVANYAREGTIGAGFDVGVIIDVGTDGAYAIPWAVGVLVLIVASVVGSIPILGQAVLFYALIVAMRVVGQGFAAARGLDGSTSPGAGVTA